MKWLLLECILLNKFGHVMMFSAENLDVYTTEILLQTVEEV